MISIENDAAFERALQLPLDDRLKRLLLLRREQYGEDIPLEQLGRIIILQTGDTLADLERETGRSFDLAAAEWTLDHGRYYESPVVLADSGFGFVVFAEKAGIDPALGDAMHKASR
jgi:hypothetical protein